ncbi:DUF222 domain-containing protein [Raineyella fluvialis]|uniref:DUF222 domain-containing protein n=1 Tax=Raineyella fluvialis TaxID=2662261 RepID=A0A5Q2FG51_9ACTN|nr:DUF222 domain-containing protein [Raineyella fluvialis]QGF23655.1 DUF222 domain-containing protein [Raineyella fluvialis]
MWEWSEALDADRMPRAAAEGIGVGIQSAATAQAQCDARLLELIGEFDAGAGWGWFEGITSCAHWLAWACSMSAGTAREHLRVARALRSMPVVAARFADGVFTYSKVRELTRLAGRVDEEQLCELASLQTASQLARTVRSYRAQDGSHLAQLARRRLSWRETDDGMVRLSVTLLPEEAAMVRGAVEAASDRQLDEPDESEQSDDGSHHFADPVLALCDVARGYLDTVPRTSTDDPHLVVVHVSAELLTVPHEVAADETGRGTATTTGSGIGVEDVTEISDDVPAGTSPAPVAQPAAAAADRPGSNAADRSRRPAPPDSPVTPTSWG